MSSSSNRLKVVYSNAEKQHQPPIEVFEGGVVQKPFEVTERCDIILKALEEACDSFEIVEPEDHGIEPLEAVHAKDYLEFLKNAWSEWEISGGGQGRESKMSPVL